MNDPQTRLNDLEAAIAHLELTVGELSDVVRRQWADIETLRRELTRLEETKADAALDGEDNQPPPHY